MFDNSLKNKIYGHRLNMLKKHMASLDMDGDSPEEEAAESPKEEMAEGNDPKGPAPYKGMGDEDEIGHVQKKSLDAAKVEGHLDAPHVSDGSILHPDEIAKILKGTRGMAKKHNGVMTVSVGGSEGPLGKPRGRRG